MKQVYIVGAGLSGLACAVELQKAGLSPTVIEAKEHIGGRVWTDEVDGFLLDRGFQVLLDSYPTAMKYFANIERKSFMSGAGIWDGDKISSLFDPVRHPSKVLETITSGHYTLSDLAQLSLLRLFMTKKSYTPKAARTTTKTFLQERFSEKLFTRFFLPFFKGIFLDSKLENDMDFFLFLFHMFATGKACLPTDGMKALPRELASHLTAETIQLKRKVTGIEDGKIFIEGSDPLSCDNVVLAANHDWFDLGLKQKDTTKRGTHCLYFAIEGRAPVTEPILLLNGSKKGTINNICFPSSVSSTYAPEGNSLCSVTLLIDCNQEAPNHELVLEELSSIFGAEAKRWRHLRTYTINEALPAIDPAPSKLLSGTNIVLAGDHTYHPSIEGAVSSGKAAAEIVKESL